MFFLDWMLLGDAECLCSFQEMQEQYLPTDTVPSNAALCAYQQAGRWEDALELLQDMRKLEPKRVEKKNVARDVPLFSHQWDHRIYRWSWRYNWYSTYQMIYLLVVITDIIFCCAEFTARRDGQKDGL